jgi:hypothetical protein
MHVIIKAAADRVCAGPAMRRAEHGECKTNPSYMGKHCRLSCKLCSTAGATTAAA